MENMRFMVEQLKKREEAREMLYNAAAKCFTLSGNALHSGIKSQEEAVAAYCKQERERLATIIQNDGKVVRDMSFPFMPYTTILYDYNGELFEIVTEHDVTTSIRYCER